MAHRKGPPIVPSDKFIIPRNDPLDNFKPNSDDAVEILATTPISKKLVAEDVAMLREVAADLDLSLPIDALEDFPPIAISDECRAQLARLPTWLRSMIVSRWDAIHKHYGHNSQKFLRVIANRIDNQYRQQYLKILGTTYEEEVEVKEEDIYEGYELLRDGPGKLGIETQNIGTAFRVAHVLGRFKAQRQRKKYWEPYMIQKAETCLRTAMVTRATITDVALLAEEDEVAHIANFNDEYEYDSDDELQDKNMKQKGHRNVWVIADEGNELKNEARSIIEMEFHEKNEDQLSKEEKKKEHMKKKMAKQDKKNNKVGYTSYRKGHPLFVTMNIRKEKKKHLLERALHRRYSRIWYTECGEAITSKKEGTQFRMDQQFHNYVVSLVSWTPFKFFIVFFIFANAILLALETQNSFDAFRDFDYMDNFFLSVYTIEFILKIYAHPYKYWMSGYNVFDFVILVLSLVKMIVDWLYLVDPENAVLRILAVLRALRILRVVSMSVQLQVLVTALVDTVKTHVVSVVILLVLLMYIGAIAAYNAVTDVPSLQKPWGSVAYGMLRMFSFVTMDGWTDITKKFETAGFSVVGRFCGIAGIVLGNFLFSSIFIAIIIMNISEATDAHRERQREEDIIRLNKKKDMIYRRQHLTMRQLLARQRVSISSDFYTVATEFQKLLRHDDFVAMQEVCSSPLWMDCLYKTYTRCHHTANILMNTHREIADSLLEFYKFYGDGRYKVEPITRSRYNRYMKIKAKLTLIKKEIYKNRKPEVKAPLRIRLPSDDTRSQQSKISHK